MKTRFIVVIAILFLLGNSITAQRIGIKEIIDGEFPFITVKIESLDNIPIDFKKLFLFENGEQATIEIDSTEFSTQRRMFCFLVDESILTNSKGKELVSKILSIASEKLQKTDLLNVLFTGSNKTENICIQPLSLEFTSDFSGLVNLFKSSLLTGMANNQLNDLYCPIDASLDFIQLKSILPGEKYLFVIKKANTNITDWQSLQAKANVQLIKLNTIQLPDEITNANEQNLLINATQKLDSLNLSKSNSGIGLEQKSYLISFYTKQNSKLNAFEIKYNEQELQATFKQPGYSGFLKQNLVFIIVIAFLLVLSIFLSFKVVRAKNSRPVTKKQKANKTLKVKNGDQTVSPISHKKTNYGSITPYITVEIEDYVDKFELKKLRTTVGRHSDNDILIANLTISNHHATITNEGGVFYIQDNDSTNGTFVNDIKITKSTIKTEDSVRLGKAKLSLTY